MTVAALVKVYDGIVLATDSATTALLPDGSAQVYNNADKIFHLHRGLPIAAMTWGMGQIGAASISALAKDLRLQFMGTEDISLDPVTYTIQEVARKTADFLQRELDECFDVAPKSSVGMVVAGYSAGSRQAEAWQFFVQDLKTEPTINQVASEDASGWMCFAQPDAADRLFRGADNQMIQDLQNALPAEHHQTIANVLVQQERQPVIPSMPFPDAIHLAKFLVDLTSGYSHFLLGPDTVGGPVEVAGINRHEGFKWIRRKHYYSAKLNSGAEQ